jgi:biotin operon repressor
MGIDDGNKIISFLDALTDVIGRSEEQPIKEVIQDLKEEGFDCDASIEKLYSVVQQASQEAKRKQLAAAREKRLEMETKGSSFTGKFVGWTKAKLIERINELILAPEPSIAVSYRDLSTRNEADLIALLEDLEMVMEMEKNKKGRNEE